MAEIRIMKHFMVEITFPDVVNEDFVSKLPEQRDVINNLMQKGIILSYSLSLDFSKLWIVILGENRLVLAQTLDAFPLAEYFKYQIVSLTFYNSVSNKFPELSLN